MESKEEIREHIKRKRALMRNGEKEILDISIFSKLINSKEYNEAKYIFVYVSFSGEVDTHKIIDYALKDNKYICVPKVISKEKGMKAVQIKNLMELKKGAYGILEPESFKHEIDEKNIDLVLVPGVAFDNFGGRVGYGGGFYDRFLKNLNQYTVKLALAYDFQVMDKVPKDELDVLVDRIINN
ncbi:5-formyltetrahydrofolate cyclo-ligase [Clostridium ganghwense]|uniref:5-formyltetrahydrofolate cyclo-ligase n=1 Tax=Clostridium ganghwense TaxID=312089 RepID=A0ABT4CRV7_9CLOT|nr:5-formyltetrahydrofolate cyclo-ligase [Clostridium ganghwense]MCY6370816.1 5-formyltetrahydrofolate cyclo-ligase [Clostridium ganghwense]